MRFSRNDSATYLASQLAKTFSKALSKRAVALGFSPGQFPILLELWHEDALTQRQLLDRVDVEQGDTSQHVGADGARWPHSAQAPP